MPDDLDIARSANPTHLRWAHLCICQPATDPLPLEKRWTQRTRWTQRSSGATPVSCNACQFHNCQQLLPNTHILQNLCTRHPPRSFHLAKVWTLGSPEPFLGFVPHPCLSAHTPPGQGGSDQSDRQHSHAARARDAYASGPPRQVGVVPWYGLATSPGPVGWLVSVWCRAEKEHRACFVNRMLDGL